jgi:nitroimidazol reductase NimA-like FMN-containing flavoprotein (pyridoxamine 5'-phosphate oxidase superfamily)
MDAPELSVLSRDECLRLLGGVAVGRVGLSIDALPVVLPVNFALFEEDIVFRTVEGTKFHAAAAGAVVAFEADSYEPGGTSGWGVVCSGRVAGHRRPRRAAPGRTADGAALGRRRSRRPHGANR